MFFFLKRFTIIYTKRMVYLRNKLNFSIRIENKTLIPRYFNLLCIINTTTNESDANGDCS